MDRTLTVPFATNQWHTVRVEGRRSTGTFRVLVDGAQVDSFVHSADTTGAKLVLGGNSAISLPTLTAWSNLYIYKGSSTACIP